MSIRSTASIGRMICALVLASCATLLPRLAAAQSLDEQYIKYLDTKCKQMAFQKDGSFNVLPGQAGPLLSAFCSGPLDLPSSGSGSDSASTGTSATAGAAADLTRRRASGEEKKQDPAANDVTILSDGRNSVFASLDYAREDQDPTHFEGGHRADIFGLVLGLDRRFGTHGVLGLAAQVEDLSGKLDAGGTVDHRAYSGLLYGSWLPTAASFVDVTGGWTTRDVKTHRIVTFEHLFQGNPNNPPGRVEYIAPALANSDADQQDLFAELRAGYDFAFGRYSAGPRLTGSYRHTNIDGLMESGPTPMVLVVDKQVEKSLRSGAGLQASSVFNTRAAVWVLQLNGDWWHEFQDNQRYIDARFAEDLRPNPTRLRYQNEPPDRDTYTAQLSLSATMPRGWSAFASAKALLGHSYLSRYGATLGLRKEL